jgi:hypothetical protein
LSDDLPTGWRVETEEFFGTMVSDYEHHYAAYHWQTWTTKKFLRKPVTRSGWRYAGYSSRHRDETAQWIKDTAKAMES